MKWVLVLEGDALLLNKERTLNRYARAKIVKEWRYLGRVAAKQAKIPLCKSIRVTSHLRRKNRSGMPDIAAEIPTTKAIIDGLRDAGVIADDSPEYLSQLTFQAPEVDYQEHPAVIICVET